MKIVLDLQAAQSESRLRGIGRYSLSLAQAIIRNAGEHDVFVALNHVFPDATEQLRESFSRLLPERHILVYRTLPQTYSRDPANHWRNSVSQVIREAFLEEQAADLVHTSSMFEGWGDNCVVSCGKLSRNYLSAVTLYDLIPYAQPERYLPTPAHRAWYTDHLDSLRSNDLMLAISDYAKRSAMDLLGVADDNVATIYADADPMFTAVDSTTPRAQKRLQDMGIGTPFIMYTGIISRNDPRKNCPGLLRAYAQLPAALRQQHQLVLVGRYNAFDHHDMSTEAQRLGIEAGQVVFTDRVDDEDLVLLYTAARLFVFPSLEEGFGLPALEAMRCGTVAIGSNCSSIPEVIGNPAALFDPNSPDDMARTMERCLTDEALRQSIRDSSVQQSAKFCWDRSARLALQAFEEKYAQQGKDRAGRVSAIPGFGEASADTIDPAVLEALRQITSQDVDQQDLVYCAQALAENSVSPRLPTKLMLDVTVLVEVDSKTGIQRVVRSLLMEFRKGLAGEREVQLIYLDPRGDFRVARYDESDNPCLRRRDDDALVEVGGTDIYLALDLDLQGVLVDVRNAFLRYHRQRGLKTYYIVYDLLPVIQSDHFDFNIRKLYPMWLRYIASEADGLICISRAVANELRAWLDANMPRRQSPLKLGYFHLGANIDASIPSTGMIDNAEQLLQQMQQRPSLLMVGTIEPRKGQQQALAAMELLWDKGIEANLVLVGKSGWEMEAFEKRLSTHPQRDQRLFWLQGISDEMLQHVYGASSVLLAASTGEGFGLPLIEAAQEGLPLLARDLPVFQEVAGEHAMYFSGDSPASLAQAIELWLQKYENDEVVPSTGLKWLTWNQSADQLGELVLDRREWYLSWQPEQPIAAE